MLYHSGLHFFQSTSRWQTDAASMQQVAVNLILVSRAHFAWLSNASSSAPDPRSTVYREGVHMLKALAIRLAVLSLGEAYACMFVIRPDRCIRSSVIIILFLLRWHCVVQRQYSVPLYQSRLRGQLGEVLVHSHHQDIAIVK